MHHFLGDCLCRWIQKVQWQTHVTSHHFCLDLNSHIASIFSSIKAFLLATHPSNCACVRVRASVCVRACMCEAAYFQIAKSNVLQGHTSVKPLWSVSDCIYDCFSPAARCNKHHIEQQIAFQCNAIEQETSFQALKLIAKRYWKSNENTYCAILLQTDLIWSQITYFNVPL